MSRRVIWINNFVKNKSGGIQNSDKIKIDLLSKFYIISELTIGLNRLHVLSIKNIFIPLIFLYNILIVVIFIYVFNLNYNSSYTDNLELVDIAKFTISTAINIFSCKKLHRFYKILNDFDKEIGFESKMSKESWYPLIQLITTIIINLMFYYLPFESSNYLPSLFHVIVVTIVHVIELHYQGHLFSLLVPRIHLIETYCKSSFSSNQKSDVIITSKNETKVVNTTKKKVQIQLLPDYYNKLIEVYDYLIDAIKWQLLTLLITTFVIALVLCFYLSKNIIAGEFANKAFYWNISYLLIEFTPLMVPCILASRVQAKVHELRELLALKLHENTLSKSDRSTARALYAMMETRNLSFSLFNMFDIDVMLPFKFIALIVTYVIIMLQFDKAIAAKR